VRGDCAQVYPGRAWEEVLSKLSGQPPSRPPVAKFRRVTSFFGQVVAADPQGRIVIPPKLREAAQIVDDVVILGQVNHLEVWNLDRFQQTLVADPLTAEDEDYLASLGI
jgi:MraZ protein